MDLLKIIREINEPALSITVTRKPRWDGNPLCIEAEFAEGRYFGSWAKIIPEGEGLEAESIIPNIKKMIENVRARP
jgi:hypothetical protein